MGSANFGPNAGMVRVPSRQKLCQVVLSICTWIVAVLLVRSIIFTFCDTRKLEVQCKDQRWLHRTLDSASLARKPIHRCSIPLVDNPHKVKVVPSTFYDLYPQRLTYTTHDEPAGNMSLPSSPLFGGYQTWKQRDESFRIKKHMKVHCGFLGDSGADMDFWDISYLRTCRFAVISGIFDAYDLPHQPSNISLYSKQLFCFLMVVNEQSLQSIAALQQVTEDSDQGKWTGIWRLIMLRNLPYDEPRRNGKLPKLLAHRMFPHTQYSIWIDGKMQLIIDPILILERYLWRDKNIFAIAYHKHHRSVYEEAESNKRRKRYARPFIDRHMEIYRQEGMEAWSVKKLPLLSDVPEGAIVIREHTHLTNLFSCLWFNEVDKFTPRDQLSFGYVVYRLNGSFPFFMFPNCEYNALTILHKHTREHSSQVEWVKNWNELNDGSTKIERRAGRGLWRSIDF